MIDTCDPAIAHNETTLVMTLRAFVRSLARQSAHMHHRPFVSR